MSTSRGSKWGKKQVFAADRGAGVEIGESGGLRTLHPRSPT